MAARRGERHATADCLPACPCHDAGDGRFLVPLRRRRGDHGDSPGTVVRKAGRQPDRIVQLENRRGAAVGERWEYYLDNKQVNFEIRGGRVVDIQEVR